MAKLLEPIRLMESPRNTPMYIEIRILGRRIAYDIDGWNKNWTAWDAMPSEQERMDEPWR